jgi:ligand-binding sensor domain-containing protein/serine phosphatase RsbU (regulator of sigma subunit)
MLKKALILLILFVIGDCYFAQKIVQAGKEYNFVHYGIDEGLSDLNIFKTYEDSKGYIWVCTQNGLGKFDGINFKNFTKKDGLPSSCVLAACEDNNGCLWVSTTKGLAIFKDNEIIKLDTGLRIPQAAIRSISKFKDGTLWLSENNHVVHLNPNNLKNPLIKIYKPDIKVEQFMFRDIWLNKKGQLIAGCEHGCFYLRNDSMVRYNSMTTPAYQMVELEGNVEWFNAWNQPIKTFKDGNPTADIDLGSATLSMIKDQNGNVWLATWERGIYKYTPSTSQNKKDGIFINFSVKEGLSFNTFWGVNEDSNGNIWFSGWGGGLFKYSGESFTKLTEKSGLPSVNLASIAEGSDGKIWIATDLGVNCYDPVTGQQTSILECNGKKLNQIVKLFIHPKSNEVWCMGYLGKGYKIINNKIIEVDSLAGFDVDMDKEGTIWIGTDDRGLMRVKGNEKKVFDTKKIHGYSRVPDIFRDTKQNLWLLNIGSGCEIFDKDTILLFRSKNGFFNEPAIAMAQDKSNFYWVLLEKRGVFKFSLEANYKFKILDSITANDGVPVEQLNSLIISNNKLYIGSSSGLLTCNIDQISSGKKMIRHFNKEDGLLDLNCAPFLVDKNGKIWLATSKGISIFDPSQSKINTTPTKTYISNIKLFFENPDWSPYSKGFDANNLPLDLNLPYQKNHLTFSFIGINFVAPAKVLYQYKLEGLDEDWCPPTNKIEADYSSIPPGTYTFMVKSCNNDGLWNTNPQTFTFTITPPFWNTLWFYALCFIAVLLLVFFFIKSREKKLQKEKLILENKVDQRTSELKEAFSQIEEKNKEITDSINYASKIQAALLPSVNDIELLTNDFFIFFKPKDIVSGDFYWSEQKENKFYFAVCDSTGHGVPGAFMSLLNLNFINEAVNVKGIFDPNQIFNYVRNELVSGISKEGQSDGFDGTLVCFDKAAKKFSYVAANTKPILIRNKTLTVLAADKMPVGKGEKNDSFTLHELNYQAGDTLYLFTDGYADQFGGPKGKKFKHKALEELLISINDLDLKQQSEILNQKFEDWRGRLGQVDDVSVVGIRL